MLLTLRRVRHNYHVTRPILSWVLAMMRCRLIDLAQTISKSTIGTRRACIMRSEGR
jgi:hypothetical protein